MQEADFILATLVTGAMATDLRSGKIYNFWLLPAFLTGLLWRIGTQGVRGAPELLLSLALALFLLYPVYLLGGIGAGDVKLFLAAASMLSPLPLFHCILAAFLLGGIVSLAALFRGAGLRGHIRFAVPAGVGILLHLGGFF